MDVIGHVNLAFTGIASFAKAPICTDIGRLQADVAVLGIPWDEGVSYRPGARFGPRAIREASTRFAFGERGAPAQGYFDIATESRRLSGVSLADCGDVDVLYLDQTTTFARARDAVRRIVERGGLPVVLGGDHSISVPAVQGMEAAGPLDIVQIDAHLDFNDDVFGVRLANGSPFKRISELAFTRKMIQVGIRGIRTREDAYRDAQRSGNTIIPMAQIRRRGLDVVREAFESLSGPCYLSLDIDAFDPPVAPGTGSPAPDGFQRWQVVEIVNELAARFPIVGFDVVEVNPMVDGTGLTASIAAETILEILAAIFVRRESTT
ncbi:MAG: agmatinase [bacterium]